MFVCYVGGSTRSPEQSLLSAGENTQQGVEANAEQAFNASKLELIWKRPKKILPRNEKEFSSLLYY
jgi:hypothetical protein